MSNSRLLLFCHAPSASSEAGELLRALAAEARALGAEVEERPDGFPLGVPAPEETVVFSPRDVFSGPGPHPSPEALARSIAICEAASLGPLDAAYLHARRAGAALAVDPAGVDRLERQGVPVRRLELGPGSAWVGPARDDPRPIEIACIDQRGVYNDRVLASFAPALSRRRCHLLGMPDPTYPGPLPTAPPALPLGPPRAEVFASAEVLLLGLGQGERWGELLRIIQAAQNGAVVVASHGTMTGPLVPGEHLLTGDPANLAVLADSLLRDRERLGEMRESARAAIGAMTPMRAAAEELLELAPKTASAKPRRTGRAAAAQSSLSEARNRVRDRLAPGTSRRRARRKQEALEEIRRRRDVQVGTNGRDPGAAAEVHRTPAYDAAVPEITVCVPLYEHADVIERALGSVAAAEGNLELLVLDDASPGPAAEVVREFLEARPWLPARLLVRSVNRGLGPGRSDMAQEARGELLFMLDADNEIYPTALVRLAAALEADPAAAFAYSMIEAHTDGRPRGLLSALPWDPARFRSGNYIDAMAMLRRDVLLGAGGYTGDVRLHGWEDFDLWCGYAEMGLRGLLHPEILCRYTLAESSMISITNLDVSDAWTFLCERHPKTLGGAPLPISPAPPPDTDQPRAAQLR